MKTNFIYAFSLVIILMSLGCATTTTRTSDRIAADTVTDFSGRWNDTDSKLVAEQMIKEMIFSAWITNFIEEEGERPVIIVGTIRNKSSEHIDTEIFVKDIERELVNSGKVKFVAAPKERLEILEERYHQQSFASDETAVSLAQETGADFILIGSLKSITDAVSGKAALFYQTDMELINIETNEKVWMGSKEIKKTISKSKTKW